MLTEFGDDVKIGFWPVPQRAEESYLIVFPVTIAARIDLVESPYVMIITETTYKRFTAPGYHFL